MVATLELPKEVIDSEWRDDIDLPGIEYEEYKDEAHYIKPEQVEKATVEKAKQRNIKIGRVALFGKNEKILA